MVVPGFPTEILPGGAENHPGSCRKGSQIKILDLHKVFDLVLH